MAIQGFSTWRIPEPQAAVRNYSTLSTLIETIRNNFFSIRGKNIFSLAQKEKGSQLAGVVIGDAFPKTWVSYKKTAALLRNKRLVFPRAKIPNVPPFPAQGSPRHRTTEHGSW